MAASVPAQSWPSKCSCGVAWVLKCRFVAELAEGDGQRRLGLALQRLAEDVGQHLLPGQRGQGLDALQRCALVRQPEGDGLPAQAKAQQIPPALPGRLQRPLGLLRLQLLVQLIEQPEGAFVRGLPGQLFEQRFANRRGRA